MTQQDSIITTNESIKTIPVKARPKKNSVFKVQALHKADSIAKADSILKADSLSKVDSVAIAPAKLRVDTLKALVSVPRGFEGVPRPLVPQTDNWVFGILLLLFFLFVFSISRSVELIKETVKNFFQVKERSSQFNKVTAHDFYTRFSLFLFSAGIFAFWAYVLLCSPTDPFSIIRYSYYYGITLLFFVFKLTIINTLGYVFLDRAHLHVAKQSYFNIISFLSIGLFPLLLIRIYGPFSYNMATDFISLTIGVVACILVIIKLFQIFFHKIVASFYILLYLCTLEFLPLITLYWAYRLIV